MIYYSGNDVSVNSLVILEPLMIDLVFSHSRFNIVPCGDHAEILMHAYYAVPVALFRLVRVEVDDRRHFVLVVLESAATSLGFVVGGAAE